MESLLSGAALAQDDGSDGVDLAAPPPDAEPPSKVRPRSDVLEGSHGLFKMTKVESFVYDDYEIIGIDPGV
jgi:hypothetical protein